MKVVKVHCGSAHVKGKARKYPYFIASLFESRVNARGEVIWVNTGKFTSPRRSFKLATEDAKVLAQEHAAVFLEGYGSLHNKRLSVTNAS